jgi:hypothetical protein
MKGAERISEGRIEAQAQKWGKERLKRTLERKRIPKRGPVIRIVDRETYEGILTSWPKLAENDPRIASLRFNPLSGEIAVPIWREVGIRKTQDGRRFLENAPNFLQLRRGRERKVDFLNLPERPVRRLMMVCCPDLEAAIRQAFHIQEKYTVGKEAEQLGKVWGSINNLWIGILKRVNEEEISVLAANTANVLKNAGLASARKEAKIRIRNRLIDVFKKDDLGRKNPLVGRTRLRSAYLEAIGLEAFSVLVKEKFLAIGGVLLMERATTRQALEDTLKALDTMMGFKKRGASVFEGLKPRQGEIEGIVMVLGGTARLLSRPRVSPYLQVARTAGIALWGGNPEYEERNRVIIGPENAKILLSPDFSPVRKLIKEERFQEAKDLTWEWVYNPIENLLSTTEEIGIEIT